MYRYLVDDKIKIEGSNSYKEFKSPFRGGVIGQYRKDRIYLKNDGTNVYREDSKYYQLVVWYGHQTGVSNSKGNGEEERIEVLEDSEIVETITGRDSFTRLGLSIDVSLSKIGRLISINGGGFDFFDPNIQNNNQYLSWRIEPRQGLSLTSGSLEWSPYWVYPDEMYNTVPKSTYPKAGPRFEEIVKVIIYKRGQIVNRGIINIK